MENNNAKIYLKYLLSGGTPAETKALLDQVSVQDMIFQLATLTSESFLPCDSETEDDSTDPSDLDECYVGNLIVRCLDSVLDNRCYDLIFNDEQIMDVMKQRISGSNYYVKRLISKHMRKYLESGGKNKDVYELVFNMLLEKEYAVFEDASNAICSVSYIREIYVFDAWMTQLCVPLVCTLLKTLEQVVTRPGEPTFLDSRRLDILLDYLTGYEESEQVDTVTMALRLLEFFTKLAKSSDDCFELLRENEVFDKIFKLYMEQDVLVKLNCLELLDSMIPLIKKLKFKSKVARDFVRHAVRLFTKKELDVDTDIVTAPLLRFFSSIVLLDNVLNETETRLFSTCVSENILNANNKSVQFYASLACFGTLFVRGLLNETVPENFLEIVKNCTHEDTLYSCLESLQFVAKCGDVSKSKFISEAVSSVVYAISKFPFGEVREACFKFILSSLEFDKVTDILVRSELESRLLSTQENSYETTLTKRSLIKKFLSRVDELYEGGTSPLTESTVKSLKAI